MINLAKKHLRHQKPAKRRLTQQQAARRLAGVDRTLILQELQESLYSGDDPTIYGLLEKLSQGSGHE